MINNSSLEFQPAYCRGEIPVRITSVENRRKPPNDLADDLTKPRERPVEQIKARLKKALEAISPMLETSGWESKPEVLELLSFDGEMLNDGLPTIIAAIQEVRSDMQLPAMMFHGGKHKSTANDLLPVLVGIISEANNRRRAILNFSKHVMSDSRRTGLYPLEAERKLLKRRLDEMAEQ